MSRAERRTESELAETGSDSNKTVEDQGRSSDVDGDTLFWKIAHPYIWPLAFWLRPSRGEELDDAILVNRIWEYLIDTHEIPFRTTSYSVLYHVMSSRVDNVQSPSRAVRMQALRNLNRGMWITSWYASLLLISVFAVDRIINPGEVIPVLNHVYEQPLFFEYWIPVWMLVLVSLAGVLFFWTQAESSEEDYIEYLFADYVVAVASEAEDISFDQDTPLKITGQLITDSMQSDPSPEDDGNRGDEDPESSENGERSGDNPTEEDDVNGNSNYGDDGIASE